MFFSPLLCLHQHFLQLLCILFITLSLHPICYAVFIHILSDSTPLNLNLMPLSFRKLSIHLTMKFGAFLFFMLCNSRSWWTSLNAPMTSINTAKYTSLSFHVCIFFSTNIIILPLLSSLVFLRNVVLVLIGVPLRHR